LVQQSVTDSEALVSTIAQCLQLCNYFRLFIAFTVHVYIAVCN